jgi:uncharacterized membrane protein YkvA (DUF1232 family)
MGSLIARFRNEVEVYRLVLRHSDTPKISRWLLGIAIAYAISPIDLIPDFIPVLGQLDDLVILPVLVWTALRMVPRHVIHECRGQVARGNTGQGVVADGHACISALGVQKLG